MAVARFRTNSEKPKGLAMMRVRMFASAGAGLALAALGCFLAAGRGMLPTTVSADMLSRSAGLALLAVAMLAIGLVFRAATAIERKEPITERPRMSEYRR